MGFTVCGSNISLKRDGENVFQMGKRATTNDWICWISANGGSKLIQSQNWIGSSWKFMNIGRRPPHVWPRISNPEWFCGVGGSIPLFLDGVWWLDWMALLDVLCTCFLLNSRNTVARNSRKPMECRGSSHHRFHHIQHWSAVWASLIRFKVSKCLTFDVKVLFVSLTWFNNKSQTCEFRTSLSFQKNSKGWQNWPTPGVSA